MKDIIYPELCINSSMGFKNDDIYPNMFVRVENKHEVFWVEVKSFNKKTSMIVGTVDEDLHEENLEGYNYGDDIYFHKMHVIDIAIYADN